MGSDSKIIQGMQEGRALGFDTFGQGSDQTALDIQNIVKRRKALLDGPSRGTQALMEKRNSALRELGSRQAGMGRSGGAGANDLRNQLERQYQGDIASLRSGEQRVDLGNYQSLIGNIASQQLGMQLGMAGLRKGGQVAPVATPPETFLGFDKSKGGFLQPLRAVTNPLASSVSKVTGIGKVICTELNRQGYISDEVLKADTKYGEMVVLKEPWIYAGYISWAPTVVKWMRASSFITKLVAMVAIPWADHMSWVMGISKKKSFSGKIINNVGSLICGFIGKLKGVKYERA